MLWHFKNDRSYKRLAAGIAKVEEPVASAIGSVTVWQWRNQQPVSANSLNY